MKCILIITAFPPNKMTAGQNFTRNVVNDLSNKGDVKIDLFYFGYNTHSLDIDQSVNIIGNQTFSKTQKFLNAFKVPLLFPLFSVRYSSKISKYLKSITGDYDYIYFDFSQVFRYSIDIEHPFKIGMVHDVILQKYTRSNTFSRRLIKPIIRSNERKLMTSLDKLFCFSYKDRDIILEQYGLKSQIVSFYIDSQVSKIDYSKTIIGDYFVMYGAWNRPENREGLEWFLENVIKNVCNVPIKIIGPGLSSYIIDGIANIEYLGFVDNPYDIIARSQGLLAPIFKGAGVKVKVIETLSTGTPVIGTEIAFEGIDNRCGQMIQCLDAKHWIKLLNNWEILNISDKIRLKTQFEHNYNNSKITDYL